MREQLYQLKILLKQSPSLKGYLIEVLPESYQFAISQVQISYPHVNFPKEFNLAIDADAFLKCVERD